MTEAKENAGKVCVFRSAAAAEARRNQFCFFLKPGVTESHPHGNCRAILDLVLGRIVAFGLRIDEVHILSGSYLRQHRIMNQHYGILYRLASNGTAMSEPMRDRFRTSFGVPACDVTILGGFEVLQGFPDLSPAALDSIWRKAEHHRLATGCFVAKIAMAGRPFYVINGFTPLQLSTYTHSTIAIVVFMLSGNRAWEETRSGFLGCSDPEYAQSGSIRRELLVHQTALGIRNVAIATNGAHLSAGPVEAVIELQRFTSDFGHCFRRPLTEFQFGRRLGAAFTPCEIDAILTNPTVILDGRSGSIFDWTENTDETEAIDRLRRCAIPAV